MREYLSLSELELRARLRKEIDIAVEIVKDKPERNPSEQLAYEEKIVFEQIKKQREEDKPLHPLEPQDPPVIPKLGIDPSGLRHHSFEDFVGSKEYQKNIKKLQKVKPP